jgi:hypothetical protein
MIINGQSAEMTIIRRDPGAPRFRLVSILAGGNLTINGLSLTGGELLFPTSGSGIFNAGTLTINRSTISDNLGGDQAAALLMQVY